MVTLLPPMRDYATARARLLGRCEQGGCASAGCERQGCNRRSKLFRARHLTALP